MMSNLQGNQRPKTSSTRKHRATSRRCSVRKSLKFDEEDHESEGNESTKEIFDTCRSLNEPESTLFPFWSTPPAALQSASEENKATCSRRSLRLQTKDKFSRSVIGDTSHASTVLPDLVLRRKSHDTTYQSVQSDHGYGTSSNCSTLYFLPTHGSDSAKDKVHRDTVVTRRRYHQQIQNNADGCDLSLGYSSDLDECMSNLSIDEVNGKGRLSECRRWESDDDCMDEIEIEKNPHLSISDLKLSNLRTSLKVFGDIHLLIPSQGYDIQHTTKCIGRKCHTRNSVHHIHNTLRYDLRKRPDCPKLENIISIETLDINIEDDFLKAGLRIFQVSPVISIQPKEVSFCTLYPAIVQIPLNLDPSCGDEVHCLYSKSSGENLQSSCYTDIPWSLEVGKCSIQDGKVNFETFQLGLFVLVIRPKCPYSSNNKNIRARVGGKLVVSGFPCVEVCFPKEATENDILRANASIYFDTEEPVSEFVARRLSPNKEFHSEEINESSNNSLATPIIKLEPHGIHFEAEPVTITLPVPDYEKIILSQPGAKLTIWQSNTHSSEPSKWEKLDVEYLISHIKSDGEAVAVVTFPVSHFSFFKGVWESISEYLHDAKVGMLYYFVSFAMKCQANMQEYPDQTASTISKISKNDDDDKTENAIKGGSRFGLEVIVFQADKPWPQMSTYKYKVGQSNPKLVKPGKICVRLKSHYFEPDTQAGEEEEMIKEESDFRGRDFEKQFICKFKPDINIERGPFGKVLVSRHVSPRQKGQPIFEFNIQKHGNEAEVEDGSAKQNEEWSMVALTELAGSLFVTEGENWKQFALEIGMTKQEIKDARLKSESQPFKKIVSHYRLRGGTAQELVNALYRCHRTLKVTGPCSGNGSNQTRSSNGSSGRGSLSSNNVHFSRFGSHDSDTSGTQTSQDSGLPPGRKRSYINSPRGSGSGLSVHSSKQSKRRRTSQEPGPSTRRLLDPQDADVDSNSDSDNILDSNSVKDDFLKRTNAEKLENKFLWQISEFFKSNWLAVGRTLGLEENVLVDIENGYNKTGFRECSYQMLLEWKQRYPKKCTFGNLYIALQKEGMSETAKKMDDIQIELE